ncbi:MAG: phenylalanine--tRNA ligase subunit alpha [Kiritimatiellaeota bacterium]|nr:phenylalanine--tRNA ligase subunit alpha [Kiritimatiellota bacterium]
MTLQELATQHAASLKDAADAPDMPALDKVRVHWLGRAGVATEAVRQMKNLPPDERPEFGKRMNAWRVELEAALEERKAGLAAQTIAAAPAFDCSLPGQWHALGTAHPISRVIAEIARIFARLGFTVADGPDIETKFNNFTALNTAPHHPSMDAADTFWLGPDTLLRTQTSPVQIRAMLAAGKPPVRVITPGRCYRRDTTDATHSANFHQIEGLYVDAAPVSLADLKSTLAHFAREMMGPSVNVRFRPHFFPFTEPSVEVDFTCHVCAGKGCRVCKQSGWIEILGAGMVDPRVYRHVGWPEDTYGYAFGMGVERIAMIKYGITDIRDLYANDLRFLNQFA